MNCTGTFTKYIYDGNGTLVKRVVTSKPTTSPATETTTVYIGGFYEKQTTGSTTKTTKYYSAFGRAIAMRASLGTGSAASGGNCDNTTDDDSDGLVNDGCAQLLLADHLGTSTAVLGSGGTLISSQKYWPYGAPRSGGITQTDKLYTGQQKEFSDAALGLYNYNARFYSTVIGSFISADPLIQSGSSSGAYRYANGNPLSWIDPTGLDPVCFITCTGTGQDLVVENEKCSACGGRSAAEIEAIRQGMLAGAAFKAAENARMEWTIGVNAYLTQEWINGVTAYLNATAEKPQSDGGGGCGNPLSCAVSKVPHAATAWDVVVGDATYATYYFPNRAIHAGLADNPVLAGPLLTAEVTGFGIYTLENAAEMVLFDQPQLYTDDRYKSIDPFDHEEPNEPGFPPRFWATGPKSFQIPFWRHGR